MGCLEKLRYCLWAFSRLRKPVRQRERRETGLRAEECDSLENEEVDHTF